MTYDTVLEELLKLVSLCSVSFDEENLGFIIESSISEVLGMLSDDADDSDPRVINLAVASAYYKFICLLATTSMTGSFSAGDVSISRESKVEEARAYYELALSACGDLVGGKNFAFRVV